MADGRVQAFEWPNTLVLIAASVAEGAVKPSGITAPVPAHCQVLGRMAERTGPVDGKPYWIGFEMRLPTHWNGHFFCQANGGLDGFVTPAYGDTLGGGPRSNGLAEGFAVISTDAGHVMDAKVGPKAGGVFGLDPQAPLDYGYNKVQQLTPMAQALVARYCGRAADKSYLVGTSNGGRHGLMAASRVLACGDALDGLADGLADGPVTDPLACQRAFDPERNIPACGPAAGGDGLGAALKQALMAVMRGLRLRDGTPFYAPLTWDSGLSGDNWRQWKLSYSTGLRDAVALSYVFRTSPVKVANDPVALLDFALGFDIDRDGGRIFVRDGVYPSSAMDFMVLRDLEGLQSFVTCVGKPNQGGDAESANSFVCAP